MRLKIPSHCATLWALLDNHNQCLATIWLSSIMQLSAHQLYKLVPSDISNQQSSFSQWQRFGATWTKFKLETLYSKAYQHETIFFPRPSRSISLRASLPLPISLYTFMHPCVCPCMWYAFDYWVCFVIMYTYGRTCTSINRNYSHDTLALVNKVLMVV